MGSKKVDREGLKVSLFLHSPELVEQIEKLSTITAAQRQQELVTEYEACITWLNDIPPLPEPVRCGDCGSHSDCHRCQKVSIADKKMRALEKAIRLHTELAKSDNLRAQAGLYQQYMRLIMGVMDAAEEICTPEQQYLLGEKISQLGEASAYLDWQTAH